MSRCSPKGPWVALPQYLGDSVLGLMFSQQWLSSLAERAAAHGGLARLRRRRWPRRRRPVTRPSRSGWARSSSTRTHPATATPFKAVRNPDYWRGPNGITGEDLPYLDAVEAVVAVDEDSRSNSARSGEFDIMMTSMGDTIKQSIDDGSTRDQLVGSLRRHAVPDAQRRLRCQRSGRQERQQPVAQPRLPQGAGPAIDRDRWAQERGGGLQRAGQRSVPAGSVGYLEDNGYPEFDIEKAKASMDTCLATLKTDHLDFSFNTTNDPFNVESQLAHRVDVEGRVRRQGARRRSHRSSRASTSASPSPARSRRSAGATTVASTPTSNGCGGRARRRCPSGSWR